MKECPAFLSQKTAARKRVVSKRRASLVVNLDRQQKRLPCLVLDSSKEGFRLRGSFHVTRGQVVGKPGSEQEDEVGLETV